ncbi:hypothetical protein PkoCFBP13504_17380 [Pseudomonas koreensis]|nr:hypothetical protein PkoCFBP13504_17380 [Pseudomonas koreensis]
MRAIVDHTVELVALASDFRRAAALRGGVMELALKEMLSQVSDVMLRYLQADRPGIAAARAVIGSTRAHTCERLL